MGGTGNQQIYELCDIGLSEPLDLTVEALIDDWEGFRVLLRNHETGGMIRVAFDAHVAYQNRDEADLAGELSRSDRAKRGHIYRVANSEFLDRFIQNSARSYLAKPRAMAPQLEAWEGERDDHYDFAVEVRLPMFGRLVRYEGLLKLMA